MNYIRQAGDKAYRIVSLTVNAADSFTAFAIPNQTVTINDNQLTKCILEVEKDDGSTVLVKPEHRTPAYYTVVGGEKIYITASVPYARLWAKHINYPFPCYKVPTKLLEEKENNRAVIMFAGGAQNVMLFGDKYFEAVFDLQRR